MIGVRGTNVQSTFAAGRVSGRIDLISVSVRTPFGAGLSVFDFRRRRGGTEGTGQPVAAPGDAAVGDVHLGFQRRLTERSWPTWQAW